MRYISSSLYRLDKWVESFAELSLSLPNGFSTMTLFQPLPKVTLGRARNVLRLLRFRHGTLFDQGGDGFENGRRKSEVKQPVADGTTFF